MLPPRRACNTTASNRVPPNRQPDCLTHHDAGESSGDICPLRCLPASPRQLFCSEQFALRSANAPEERTRPSLACKTALPGGPANGRVERARAAVSELSSRPLDPLRSTVLVLYTTVIYVLYVSRGARAAVLVLYHTQYRTSIAYSICVYTVHVHCTCTVLVQYRNVQYVSTVKKMYLSEAFVQSTH